MLIEKTQVVGPFQCNCKLLVCESTGEAVMVDPGDEPQALKDLLAKTGQDLGQDLQLKALLHTHAHLDHIGATRALKEAFPETQIFLHSDDREIYDNLVMQGQLFGMEYEAPLPVDQALEHEGEVSFGEYRVGVVHTPGHSPGSVCLRVEHDGNQTLYSGDTLFQGSIGRTDLWGGDQDLLLRMVRERVFVLDGDTRVCPGHGPDSAVGVEKRSNPFFI